MTLSPADELSIAFTNPTDTLLASALAVVLFPGSDAAGYPTRSRGLKRGVSHCPSIVHTSSNPRVWPIWCQSRPRIELVGTPTFVILRLFPAAGFFDEGGNADSLCVEKAERFVPWADLGMVQQWDLRQQSGQLISNLINLARPVGGSVCGVTMGGQKPKHRIATSSTTLRRGGLA